MKVQSRVSVCSLCLWLFEQVHLRRSVFGGTTPPSLLVVSVLSLSLQQMEAELGHEAQSPLTVSLSVIPVPTVEVKIWVTAGVAASGEIYKYMVQAAVLTDLDLNLWTSAGDQTAQLHSGYTVLSEIKKVLKNKLKELLSGFSLMSSRM